MLERVRRGNVRRRSVGARLAPETQDVTYRGSTFLRTGVTWVHARSTGTLFASFQRSAICKASIRWWHGATQGARGHRRFPRIERIARQRADTAEEVCPFDHPAIDFPLADSCLRGTAFARPSRPAQSRRLSRKATRLAPTSSHSSTSSGYPLFFTKTRHIVHRFFMSNSIEWIGFLNELALRRRRFEMQANPHAQCV